MYFRENYTQSKTRIALENVVATVATHSVYEYLCVQSEVNKRVLISRDS